jgi:hypothetical protein
VVGNWLRTSLGAAHAKPARAQWPWRVLNDLVVLLAMVTRGDVKKTKAEALAKSSSLLLKDVLNCANVPWRQEFHKTVFMLMEYGLARGFIRESGEEFVEDRERLRQWLSAPPADSHEDLVSFCLEGHMPWNWSFLRTALSVDAKQWLSTANVPVPCRSTLLDALRVADCLGVVDLVRTGETVLFRLSPNLDILDGADAPDSPPVKITIMPDFKVLIPAEARPSDLHSFCRLGTISALDQVYRGAILRESVCGSLAAGCESGELVEWLQHWRAPANVVETVREWIREFGRLSLTGDTVIVSSDPKVTAVLGTYGPLQGLIFPMPADAVFRIRPGRERYVADILKGLGYDHRTPRLPDMHAADQDGDDLLIDQEAPEEVQILHDLPSVDADQPVEIRGSKYNSTLRERDVGEIMQLIDYSVLMGHNLKFEYEGSGPIRKATYTVVPVSYSKGGDPVLEAEDTNTGTRKRYLLASIKRIGVTEQ